MDLQVSGTCSLSGNGERIMSIEVITYSLRDGHKRSDAYYRDVATFADEMLAETKDRTGPLVAAF